MNSRNNCQCNFDPNNPVDTGQEWNYNGTSEWEFIDTYISSIVDQSGKEDRNSPLMGARVFSNNKRPLAKLVDLDVDFQVTTLYGLKFGIEIDGETVLQGDWSIAVIVRDMWYKMKCILPGEIQHHDIIYGTTSTSRITTIQWSDKVNDLQIATQCKECTGDLAVSISLHYYSGGAFTVGDIVGTIGVAKKGEPLNVGGDRKLETTNPTLTFEDNHICSRPGVEISDNEQWTGVAPFTIDKSRNTLVIDIGNAFPVDVNNDPLDLGKLWFGVLTEEEEETVTIFGDPLPYKDQDIRDHGSIVEQAIDLNTVPLDKSLLVIVKEMDSESSGDNIYPINEVFPSLQRQNPKGQLFLKELEYFVRPTEYYMDRLEHSNPNGSPKDSSMMTLLVTSFGQHVEGAVVNLEALDAIPEDGIIAIEKSQVTDNSGLVTFTFKANLEIPFPRLYGEYPCGGDCPGQKDKRIHPAAKKGSTEILHSLPIDGQVYHFCYYVTPNSMATGGCKENPKIFSEVLSFLSFSTMKYERPYTWVDHVSPIFTQVYHLHYIMRTILDLSNYTEVTLPYNIKLLQLSLTQDISDANYMPVTRDLSPTKKDMILEWLNKPCYDKSNCDSDSDIVGQPNNVVPICQTPPSPTLASPMHSYFIPPRCQLKEISYNSDPEKNEPFFRNIYRNNVRSTFALVAENPPRPLFGYGSEEESEEISRSSKTISFFPSCSVDSVRDQLQLAVQLEFSTIPLYLTALYSIMEDCNVEAYQLMRNIVMQEMLHLAQVSNILIAIGGNARVDDADVVPSYPIEKLPGGVLPGLRLDIKKFSLEHVYYNFMALEIPTLTTIPKPQGHWNTIGQFYKEIELCLFFLRKEIFVSETEAKQVEWPWGTQSDIGVLYKVKDWKSAKQAIDQIIEQGEGAKFFDPKDHSTDQYAHFFRFEEIVCQHRLQKLPKGHGYAYIGDPIPYNPEGVWPMRENPTKENIVASSKCYTQARAFHQVYRNFLRVLQDMFNGRPEKMNEVVKLMESLNVHAKKAIWTPFDSKSTCGPIWDYDWDYTS